VHSLKTYKGVECIAEERTDPMVGFLSIEIQVLMLTCRVG
jgi:hypothetical protein